MLGADGFDFAWRMRRRISVASRLKNSSFLRRLRRRTPCTPSRDSKKSWSWTITHIYGLMETTPFITICEPRPETRAYSRSATEPRSKPVKGVELITSPELRVMDAER